MPLLCPEINPIPPRAHLRHRDVGRLWLAAALQVGLSHVGPSWVGPSCVLHTSGNGPHRGAHNSGSAACKACRSMLQ